MRRCWQAVHGPFRAAGRTIATSDEAETGQQQREPSRTPIFVDGQGWSSASAQCATLAQMATYCLTAVRIDGRRVPKTWATSWHWHSSSYQALDSRRRQVVVLSGTPVSQVERRWRRHTDLWDRRRRALSTDAHHTVQTSAGRPGTCQGQKISTTCELTYCKLVAGAVDTMTNAADGGRRCRRQWCQRQVAAYRPACTQRQSSHLHRVLLQWRVGSGRNLQPVDHRTQRTVGVAHKKCRPNFHIIFMPYT